MKTKIFIFVLMLLSSMTSKAKNLPVHSTIKSVTVFLNRAEVTNSAQVNLNAGTHTLVFDRLSTKLIRNSIQVSTKGAVTLMSVKHRVNYLNSQKKSAQLTMLESKLETQMITLQQLKNKDKIYQEEAEMILQNKSVGGQNNGVSAQRLKEVADFYRQRLLEISNKRIQLRLQIQKQNKKVSDIQKQIREEQSNTNKPSSEIIMVVKANSATRATFDVSYIVQNAGWTPIYDIRAKDTKNPIKLAYKANVYQTTGVDWKNVKLKLSTGNPAVAGNKPHFRPMYIDQYQMRSGYNKSESAVLEEVAVSSKRKEKKYDKVEEEVDEDGATLADLTEVSVNTFSTEFEITVPYTIPSDGKPQLVDVQIYDVNTHYRHEAIPQLDNDAFLMADLLDWEKYNLLPGNANVYFEGTFVGETNLEARNTTDTLSISLGRDKKVIIDRQKIKDFTSKKFFGTNIKENIGQEISIRNTKSTPVDITIEEPLPVSMHNSIEVKMLEISGAEFDEVTGKLTWKLRIEPKQTQKLIIKYALKYPKKMKIQYR